MTEFRFTFDPQIGGDASPFVGEPVSSQELAEGQLNVVANYTLLLHETGLMPDYSNYGFIERRVDGGMWEMIEEDDT